jgi:hypothetical protein
MDLTGGKVRMRQVAVALDCQRQGVETALVRYSERYAALHGYREVYAHAREAAVPFYTRLGYEVVGDRFIEVGLSHFTVRKAMAASGRHGARLQQPTIPRSSNKAPPPQDARTGLPVSHGSRPFQACRRHGRRLWILQESWSHPG